MDLLTIVGFLTIIVIVVLLLSGKVSMPVIFTFVPIIAALICGFAGVLTQTAKDGTVKTISGIVPILTAINGYITTGLNSVLSTVALFTFAVIYFQILNDVGMFDVIVNKVMKFLGNKVEVVLLMAAFVATISHLDGSGATTVLVTVPMMLPIFKKMKMSPLSLCLMVGLASGAMNMTPWCSSVMRITSATGQDAYTLWTTVLPLQILCLILCYLVVIPVGKLERKRGAGMTDAEFEQMKAELSKPVETKVSSSIIAVDIIVTVLILVVLLLGWVKANMGFMIALAIALIVNYKTPKEQAAKIKEFGGTALYMCMIIFCIGILVGVLKDSGMMNAMVKAILAIMPESIGMHLTWICGVLSVPLSMFLGSDSLYMTIAPILGPVVTTFGSSSLLLDAAFLIGGCLSASLCLVGPSPYLMLGLAGAEMKDNLKYCFPWVFGINLIAMIVAGFTGIIPF